MLYRPVIQIQSRVDVLTFSNNGGRKCISISPLIDDFNFEQKKIVFNLIHIVV